MEAFKERGSDFLVADTVDDLLARMRQASPELLDIDRVLATDELAELADVA